MKALQLPRERDCRRSILLAGPLALLLAGCMHLPTLKHKEEPPSPPVCQIAATWDKDVVFAPDSTHGGKPTPGLSGRLYLFGQDSGFPLVGDGSATVELFDDSPVASGGQPKLLEKWCLDKSTLKRLVRKDMIGKGYTLLLPWGTYRPDITQVHLMVSYTPPQGTPLYAPSATLPLSTGGSPITVTQRQVLVDPAHPERALIQTANARPNVESTGAETAPKDSSVIVQRVAWKDSQ